METLPFIPRGAPSGTSRAVPRGPEAIASEGGRMGFLDFIGDALGALTSPFTAVLDAGTKLLGLPPAIGDALKIAVGVATGDVVTLMQGSTQLMKDLAASSAETEYAPRADEAYGGADGWAPAASDGTDVTDSPE